MQIQCLLTLALAACCIATSIPPHDNSVSNSIEPRSPVINGFPARFNHAPYMVSIELNNSHQFCGGTIINATRVLTAAHCVRVYPINHIFVRVGAFVGYPIWNQRVLLPT